MGDETRPVATKADTAPPVADAAKAPSLDARGIPIPPLEPATVTGRSAVAMLQGRIEQERQTAAMWRDFNLAVVAVIDQREAAGQQTGAGLPANVPPPAAGMATDAEVRANARAEADRAGATFAAATRDLRTLADPVASGAEFHEVIARRGLWVRTPPQFTTSGSLLLAEERADDPRLPKGWTYGKNKLTRTGTETELSIEVGPSGRPTAITKDATRTQSVGWDATLGNLTVGSGTSSKETRVSGERKEERETGTTRSFSVGTNTGYTRDEVREKTAITPGGDGKKQVFTDSSKLTVDSGGVNYGTTKSLQQGNETTSRTTTGGFRRGDGTAVGGVTSSAKKGTVDDEGTLTKGRSTSVGGAAGLYNDKELGTGLGGDLATDNSYTRKGLDLGLKVGGGGRWFVNVKKVEGSPDQVLLVTTIMFTVSANLTAGSAAALTPVADKESGGVSPGLADAATKDKLGVSVNLGRAETDRATFARKVSVEQAKAYLDIMARNGEGGTMPEHSLLAAGYRNGWASVQKAWHARTPEAMAGDAATLGKDEYLERAKESTTSAGGGLKLSAGDLELGGTYGHTSKRQVIGRITGSDETTVDVSITVNQVDVDSFGGSAKLGVTGGSYGRDLGISAGSVYVFHVPNGEKGVIAEMLRASTVADLVRLLSTYPTMMKGRSELSGKTDTEKIGLSVGPLNLKLVGASSYGEKVDFDAKGNRTGATYTAASDTGGAVGLGGVDIGSSDQRTYTGSVDDKGGANDEARSTGKSERGSTSFSPAKTWEAVKNLNDPLKIITDGPGSLVRSEKTVDRGLFYGNEDFDAIVWQAHDQRAWMAKVTSNHRRPDWQRCMYAIRRASRWVAETDGVRGHYEYDAHKVQKALATWNASADSERLDAVDSLVRDADGQGGVVAAFPAQLAAFEADFKRYVVHDQIRDSKTLKAADDAFTGAVPGPPQDPSVVADLYRTALADLKVVETKLQALNDGLKDQAGQFTTPGMHAEMMGRIVKRLSAARNEISATQERIAEAGVQVRATTPVVMKGGKPDAEATARREVEAAEAAKVAEEEKQARDAKAGEAEARTNFDQMWRHNADLHRLIDQAHYLYADSVHNMSKVNTALSDAKGQLSSWDGLRTRNDTLVTRHSLGDWLRGPDPAPLRARYSTVWAEVHKGY